MVGRRRAIGTTARANADASARADEEAGGEGAAADRVPGGLPSEDVAVGDLSGRMASCRVCRDAPARLPALPHEPRPIFVLSPRARIVIASQAPGLRAHESGVPFNDPSGNRLRDWLGVDRPTFYDPDNFAIVPMGFCFPGYDRHGGDLPPRRECAPAWRQEALAALPAVTLTLLIGSHAQAWHAAHDAQDARPARRSMTETVASWREIFNPRAERILLPLPHPSWRNTSWLKKNPWFEEDLLPVLRKAVDSRISRK